MDSAENERLIYRFPRSYREHVRVTVGEYKGKRHLGIRIWFDAGSAGEKPSPKGVNIPLEQVPDLIAALNRGKTDGWLP